MNEAFSNLAIEQAAETLDTENPNPDVAVCTLCRQSSVRRVKETKIFCEMAGCIEIDLKCNNWTVEQIMQKLSEMVFELKKAAEESGISDY